MCVKTIKKQETRAVYFLADNILFLVWPERCVCVCVCAGIVFVDNLLSADKQFKEERLSLVDMK